ncbi:MAG: TauD/TfdA family dioxygenase [Actinomycetales bacterium]
MDVNDLVRSTRTAVDRDGFTTFRAGDRDEFLAFCRALGTVLPHRDGDADGVTRVRVVQAARGVAGLAGLGAGALDPHTDGSGTAHPPKYIVMWCRQAADHGGDCVVVDGRQVVADLTAEASWALAALSQRTAVVFRSGEEQYTGPVIVRTPDGHRWRLRLDTHGYFSADVQHALARLREAIARRTRTMRLEPGEGYVLDNEVMLHGRSAFGGDREMLRVLLGDLRPPRTALTLVE